MNSALPKKITLENIFSFHGGVHPEENKQQTSSNGIVDAGLPKDLIVPLQQHIGAPAKAIVRVGDTVLKGQLIAEANGFDSNQSLRLGQTVKIPGSKAIKPT